MASYHWSKRLPCGFFYEIPIALIALILNRDSLTRLSIRGMQDPDLSLASFIKALILFLFYFIRANTMAVCGLKIASFAVI
jgi:hypothetical protein